jgi:hypothetical protein
VHTRGQPRARAPTNPQSQGPETPMAECRKLGEAGGGRPVARERNGRMPSSPDKTPTSHSSYYDGHEPEGLTVHTKFPERINRISSSAPSAWGLEGQRPSAGYRAPAATLRGIIPSAAHNTGQFRVRSKLAMRLCCSARHGGSQPSGALGENDCSQSRLGRTTEHASVSF